MAPREFSLEEWKELNSAFQRLGLPNPTFRKMFERRHSRLQGHGLFAREKIPRGTPILIEAPSFWVINDNQITARAAEHPQFNDLHCPSVSAIQRTDQRRFAANCFEMGYHGRDRGVDRPRRRGIFFEASRFNHSCIPNAHFAWDDDRAGPNDGRLTIYAIVDIARNAEILVNYGTEDYHQSRPERQRDSRDVYGFTCTCRACVPGTDFAKESEAHRTQMRMLDPRIENNRDLRTQSEREKQYSDIVALARLLEQNDTIYPQQARVHRELALWYQVELNQALGVSSSFIEKTREKALEAARASLDLDILCTGYESAVAKATLVMIEGLKP